MHEVPSQSIKTAKKQHTVKQGYSEQTYNELTLISKWFSFPVTKLRCNLDGFNELCL